MQLKCKSLAVEYNRKNPPQQIDVLMPWVVEVPARPAHNGQGNLLLFVEPMLRGKYVKFSNNFGYVSNGDPTPHAFSHFTWVASGGKALACDIQGVGCMYTDPQLHSNEGNGVYAYGMGDHGMDGIKRFFASHRCNHICRMLGLVQGAQQMPTVMPYMPQQTPLIMPMPAVQEPRKMSLDSRGSSRENTPPSSISGYIPTATALSAPTYMAYQPTQQPKMAIPGYYSVYAAPQRGF
eukprot:NODE_1547_length_1130_cov_125.521739_g1259_i0.p1 GENE.NODE_1547_length_1130_cov_125.521739_g1259_i0~~NODE_1547_length_1130_cov_125.521739_g1259_i0.p1  ORF type:complete len:266 (-),score=69.01 NODE_1547_length_1130_cov_125.521739_g1259_i0:333-1040(-)